MSCPDGTGMRFVREIWVLGQTSQMDPACGQEPDATCNPHFSATPLRGFPAFSQLHRLANPFIHLHGRTQQPLCFELQSTRAGGEVLSI
jgi:hypothetical protein